MAARKVIMVAANRMPEDGFLFKAGCRGNLRADYLGSLPYSGLISSGDSPSILLAARFTEKRSLEF